MARQKCVMNAMLQQISPQTAVRNFEKIAKAQLRDDLHRPARRSELDPFMALALKAKSQKISTLSLVPPMINTGDPDIDADRRKVAEAIDRAEGDARRDAKPKKRADQPVTGGSLGSLSEGYAANQSDDLGAGLLSAPGRRRARSPCGIP